MGWKKEVLSLLLLAVVHVSYAEVFYNIIKHQENPCVNICKEAPLPITNVSDVSHILSLVSGILEVGVLHSMLIVCFALITERD